MEIIRDCGKNSHARQMFRQDGDLLTKCTRPLQNERSFSPQDRQSAAPIGTPVDGIFTVSKSNMAVLTGTPYSSIDPL